MENTVTESPAPARLALAARLRAATGPPAYRTRALALAARAATVPWVYYAPPPVGGFYR
jgi:hypothetical protein